MKNLIIASFLLLGGPLAAIAQPSLSNNPQSTPRFRSNGAENSGFGLKGGVNFNSIKGDGVNKLYDGGTDGLTQYHFGAYAQIGVSNWFSIQPELLYQRKGFKGKEVLRNRADLADSTGTNSTVKLSYLSVPVLFVFNVFDNVAIQIGPQVSYLLNIRSGDKQVDADAYKFNSVDVGAVGGIEAKLEFLRFGARYDYSLTDLRSGDAYSVNSIKRQAQSDIRNGTFQVYLGVGL